jgi:hypothetical protein
VRWLAVSITGLKPCAYRRRETASVAITDGEYEGGYESTVCGVGNVVRTCHCAAAAGKAKLLLCGLGLP